MRILSIHLGHDASFCLYNDGVIEKYILSERISRIKHDAEILKILDIFLSLNCEVDYIVVDELNCGDTKITLKYFIPFFEAYKEKYNNIPEIRCINQHHLYHASLSFYNSGFDRSLVVVVDGMGAEMLEIGEQKYSEVESVYIFDNNKKSELIYKNIIPSFYNETLFIGDDYNYINDKIDEYNFTIDKKNFDCKNIIGIGILYDIAGSIVEKLKTTGNYPLPHNAGKAMGLSSYGNNNELFSNIFLENNSLDNELFFNKIVFTAEKLSHNPEITKDNYKLSADFCYEIQQQTQKAVSSIIKKYVEKTGIKKVCISGGYGMNIIANYHYIQEFPDVEFYFEPLCNDSGISIGSAIHLYQELTNYEGNHKKIDHTFYHGLKMDVSRYKGEDADLNKISQLLFQNKSVAVYTGLAEAGQRALGNRSILFNALNPDAKDLVNKIKKREWYRPFAAVVLEEDANIYFDMGRIKSSPLMTICFPVREEYKKIISGVTHVDGTCRIQTVNSGYLYDLLKEFKNLSGHGILLNTSFNLAGEPLVETPNHAFGTLNSTCLDYLWFEETKQLFKNSNEFLY